MLLRLLVLAHSGPGLYVIWHALLPSLPEKDSTMQEKLRRRFLFQNLFMLPGSYTSAGIFKTNILVFPPPKISRANGAWVSHQFDGKSLISSFRSYSFTNRCKKNAALRICSPICYGLKRRVKFCSAQISFKFVAYDSVQNVFRWKSIGILVLFPQHELVALIGRGGLCDSHNVPPHRKTSHSRIIPHSFAEYREIFA